MALVQALIDNSSASLGAIARVRRWLGETQRLAVLTGAGVSAESGVPTFRDAASGYWARFNPEEMASEAGYRRDPALVWRWYEHRRALLAGAVPNEGHLSLARWSRRYPGRMTLITQNVDGLHQQAGSEDVLSLHGELNRNRWLSRCCASCDLEHPVPGEPPHCAACGNLLRPDVVWFGESLPRQTWALAEQAAEQCQLMLVIGTSGAVYPAAGLARIARRNSARVVILNPHASELDPVADQLIALPSAQALPLLLANPEEGSEPRHPC
ncbi:MULTISPECIES: SIR2 family NAD-dependent protein deacylase [Comamonas]|uniref:SIR2 family NAD-dependent protein deacylase n=1 Tax=Comamonas TaxID=283 RepID=UPI0012C9E28B|nr:MULTISPECIES: NAD-dependent deacylase [Comamonas]MDR3067772.1 NAD-dependent deacylase [Comamonas sp.]MEB5966879.1 NAD-dependent deacylase [Comamonas testosteroni]MPS94790.1 NAD-dependent deacylase [Comamonas sp.]